VLQASLTRLGKDGETGFNAVKVGFTCITW